MFLVAGCSGRNLKARHKQRFYRLSRVPGELRGTGFVTWQDHKLTRPAAGFCKQQPCFSGVMVLKGLDTGAADSTRQRQVAIASHTGRRTGLGTIVRPWRFQGRNGGRQLVVRLHTDAGGRLGPTAGRQASGACAAELMVRLSKVP
jgi:hypothetical protein